METNPNEYDPGTDQNQGVVGTMARNQQEDPEEDATQVPRLDPNQAIDTADTSAANDPDSPATDTMGERRWVGDEEPV